MKNRLAAALGVGFLLAGTAAYASGIWPGFDPTQNLTYVPSGAEYAPFDTGNAAGVNPATAGLMAYQIAGSASASSRNALVGGDFGTNPWQRGTAASADIANTLTYYADQWWNVGGASSAINVTKETGATDITSGFAASLRFQRKASNANTAQICMGQVLPSENSTRFQGKTAVLSFYMKSGANFSAASNNVQVTIASGTGADESASNFNTAAWTGYANAYQANTPITTTWTRYSVAGAIPATATQVGVKFCFTPVGTAGANDWFEIAGAQLETSGATVPSGSTATLSQIARPTTFDRRTASQELMLAERYFWRIAEPSATTKSVVAGLADTTTSAQFSLLFPVTMRAVPTTSVTAGTWTALKSDASAPATCTAAARTTSNTAQFGGISVASCTAASFTAGNASLLAGQGGAGVISFSSEL